MYVGANTYIHNKVLRSALYQLRKPHYSLHREDTESMGKLLT